MIFLTEKRKQFAYCRFLRNCQICYFESTEGQKVQRYVPLTMTRRIELCEKFGYTCLWEPLSTTRTTETSVVLTSPGQKEPLGNLAEVGGECFFSSIYYLLCGRKSGIYRT